MKYLMLKLGFKSFWFARFCFIPKTYLESVKETRVYQNNYLLIKCGKVNAEIERQYYFVETNNLVQNCLMIILIINCQ